ncbi:MAG: YtxH domain-containing protein [Pleurocapsa minor GSE-CHR-MK-17-07R]|jgi:gas vesicle protein|nr:YtxH domain-containing protein [Pleurocapsa minor GSE-CHR-MK 17-07R]
MNTDRVYYSRDAEVRANRERTALVILATVVGLGIGALMALLMAERPGRDVRHQIGENVEKVVSDVQKEAQRLQQEITRN